MPRISPWLYIALLAGLGLSSCSFNMELRTAKRKALTDPVPILTTPGPSVVKTTRLRICDEYRHPTLPPFPPNPKLTERQWRSSETVSLILMTYIEERSRIIKRREELVYDAVQLHKTSCRVVDILDKSLPE